LDGRDLLGRRDEVSTGIEPGSGKGEAKLSPEIEWAGQGDPSDPSLSWPKYDESARATMQLGLISKVVYDPNSAERNAWNGLPFDGVTPNTVSIWGLVWANEAP